MLLRRAADAGEQETEPPHLTQQRLEQVRDAAAHVRELEDEDQFPALVPTGAADSTRGWENMKEAEAGEWP